MYICPRCNAEVPNPSRNRCPRGHALSDGRIFGATKERSAEKAFGRALFSSLAVIGIMLGVNTVRPIAEYFPYAFIAFLVFGLTALQRGWKWNRMGGPVRRLVPRAVGTGLGLIMAGGLLLGLGITFGFVR